MTDEWERHAGWWQREFTDGADPEYEEQILPLAVDLLGGYPRVLDVGCGEGQVARRLVAAGATTVVGIDPTRAQMSAAVDRAGGPRYGVASAASLPFAPSSFDAVVACLVFEHIVEVDASIDEIGRVLRPGGRLALFLNHPFIQAPGSGWIDDHIIDPPEQYWRIGPYLPESTDLELVDQGVTIPFIHRPLSRYVNAIADAGMVVERLVEPAPPAGFLARAPEYPDAADFPRLLVVVARR